MNARNFVGQYLHPPHIDIASSERLDGSEHAEHGLPEPKHFDLMPRFGPFRPLPRSDKTPRADGDTRSPQSQAAGDDVAPAISAPSVGSEPTSPEKQSETEDAMSLHDANSRPTENDVDEGPEAASQADRWDTVDGALGRSEIDNLIGKRFEAEIDELVARSLEGLIVRRARSRLAELAAPPN